MGEAEANKAEFDEKLLKELLSSKAEALNKDDSYPWKMAKFVDDKPKPGSPAYYRGEKYTIKFVYVTKNVLLEVIREKVKRVEELENMLSIKLDDGSYLKIGDCFTVINEYPFFNGDNENYNAEVCWDDDSKTLYYEIYPVSKRVVGCATGGTFDNVDITKIKRREAKDDE